MKLAMVVAAALAGCGGSSAWTEVDVPQPQFLSTYSIWVAGDDDVWLGGSSLWHYDGTGWTEAPPPVQTGVGDFWGFSPHDIYAVGDSHLLHWDGAAWTDVPANNGVTLTAMWRIWGASPGNVYIANQDNSRVYHYDSGTWSVQTLQFVMADALWGSGPNDIWLTGVTDLYHFDGSTWREDESANSPHGGYGIWGSGPNDVWVAGGFDELSHWDGATWKADEDIDGSYNNVWGAASDDVFAVGNNGMVAHWDGGGWSVSKELGVRQNFTRVHGSSATNIWATGADPSAPRAFVLRYSP